MYALLDVTNKCWLSYNISLIVAYSKTCLVKHGCLSGTCHSSECVADVDVIIEYNNGLVQDCSKSNALAMKLLQSFSKPSIANKLNVQFSVNHLLKICTI